MRRGNYTKVSLEQRDSDLMLLGGDGDGDDSAETIEPSNDDGRDSVEVVMGALVDEPIGGKSPPQVTNPLLSASGSSKSKKTQAKKKKVLPALPPDPRRTRARRPALSAASPRRRRPRCSMQTPPRSWASRSR